MQTPLVQPDDRDPARYGRSFADVYDTWYAAAFDTEAALTLLRHLAGDGCVLELGAGTGRLAIPLARDGLDVVALDSSPEMLDRLRAHDPARLVTTVLADMADPDRVGELGNRRFDVIACACSSVLNLPDVDSIGRCIARAARLLTSDGVLVIEAIVPADAAAIPRRSLTPAQVRSDAAVFVETEFDPSTARLHGRHIEVGDGSVTTRPWSVVLCDPERFDSLAADAGLVLAERWADWARTPFDDVSATHVSVWRRSP